MSEKDMLQMLLKKLDSMESKMETMESKMDVMAKQINVLQENMQEVKCAVKSLQYKVEDELCRNIERVSEEHRDLSKELKEVQVPSQELEIVL